MSLPLSPALIVSILIPTLLLVTGRTAPRPTPSLRVPTTEADDTRLMGANPVAWRAATPVRFGTAPYGTGFRALRTESGLWLRFDAADANPWNTLTRHDDELWTEEVVEVFVDPDGDGRNYAEIEISPANVVCDLLMHRGDPDKLGDIEWDFAGLSSRVHPWLDSAGQQQGWIAIALLPWTGFAALPQTQVRLPPGNGDRWRLNVFRIKRPHGPQQPDRNVILDAWSPVPGGSFHVPEVFGEMIFE